MRVILFASVLTLAACGGEKPPEPNTAETAKVETPPPATTATVEAPPPEKKEEPKKEEPPPPPKKKTPTEVIQGSTFMFSLPDSPDAKKAADDKCAKSAKKDEKKLLACQKEAEDSAANEGIRFEKDDKGDWYWVSFGKEKDKEVIYNRVKYKIATESEGKLVIAPEGKDMGKKAMKTLPKEMVVEVTDEMTVAMSDPGKGKLVFKKK